MTPPPQPLIPLRKYQAEAFWFAGGVLVLHWSRQIGKSYTLAAWALDRCLAFPGRLVTVLSNSRANGAEFMRKVEDHAATARAALETEDMSGDTWRFETMRLEARLRQGRGRWSRVLVLAASPRTARGFSGDLVLDEFAFHEDSAAIWDAAEPIISANPDYCARIASTGNGRHNLFYRMAAPGLGPFPVQRVPRSLACQQGVKILDPVTRREITPEEARAASLDKASYDQNYECAFADERTSLLTHDLVADAERTEGCELADDHPSADMLARLRAASGPLYIGWDVARRRNLSVISALERVGHELVARAVLRVRDTPLDQQSARLDALASASGRNLRQIGIDATGMGEGPADLARARYGWRARPIHFSSRLPMTAELASAGERGQTAPAPIVLAARLHRLFLARQILIPADPLLREDLLKPARVITETGRASISVPTDAESHADHFWSLALAAYCATGSDGTGHDPVYDPGAIRVGRPTIPAPSLLR